MCPHCGKDNAYRGAVSHGYNECRYCGHTVSITKFGFGALKRNQSTAKLNFKSQSFSESSSHLVFTHPRNIHLFVDDVSHEQNKLFVYDLYACLSSKRITKETLARYNYSDIYDLKVIEKLVYLGLFHKRYGNDLLNEQTLEKQIDKLAQGEPYSELKPSIYQQIDYLFSQMSKLGLWKHYNEVELPFIFSLTDLIREGIYKDKEYLIGELEKLELERNALVEPLRSVGIDTPNPESLKLYLNEKYGKNKGSDLLKYFFRLGAKRLEQIDPVFKTLSKINKVERGANVINQILCYDGNIKPAYQIVGSSTGRCTSKKPNIMGLPKTMRHILRAEPNMSIVECDYKQMEVGVLAALSKDEVMLQDYNTGDIYQEFADKLSLKRDEAKLIFISIIYGMHSSTLALMLGQSELRAKQLIAGFHTRYRKLKVFQDALVHQGKSVGYVETKSGLKRFVNNSVYKSAAVTQWEENWLRNYPVQANAAIIFKKAIIELAHELFEPEYGFKLLVPHYDAVVFQAPSSKVKHYTEQVKQAMIRSMRQMFPELNPQITVKDDVKTHWS
jgi:DNA polymerase I-like protein with 3'-5' exonuclease and polymerase domains